MSFSAKNRANLIQQLKDEPFDLVVIGGGITGAGIALDAITRGLKVAVIEKNDFAFGTSSRSTKLIHGGLRYLKQLEFGIVREVGQERTILYKNAPHIVIPERMLLPIIEQGSLGKKSTSLGLYVYDTLAGVAKTERRYMLDKKQTLTAEPLLKPEIVKGGGMYYEYRSDDARLTIEVFKTAVAKGALCINYTMGTDFSYNENGIINGIFVKDTINGEVFKITTKKVINAAGPWVDILRDKDKSLHGKRLHLTKGVHIVVPKTKMPIQYAMYFDVKDGRMIFAIPRASIIYIGTTDTNYNQNINYPYTTKEDVAYLLNAVNDMFPTIHLKSEDIISTWAGLRPLIHEDGKSPSDLSRKDEIFISKTNLISIAGGKLTGFRKMAERAVNVVCKQLAKEEGKIFNKCITNAIPLSGGNLEGNSIEEYARKIQLQHTEISLDVVLDLVEKYGSNTATILTIAKEITNDNTLLAEAYYCLHNEMTYSIGDFLIRRTGRVYFDRNSLSNEIISELHQFYRDKLQYTRESEEQFKLEFTQEFEGVVSFKK